MENISRIFFLLSLVFLLLGFILSLTPQFPKLPGDILIEKDGVRIYIPLTSSLIISLLLIILFNFLRK